MQRRIVLGSDMLLRQVCIANFPESFSGSSLLVTQGMSPFKAFGMWLVAFVLEVALLKYVCMRHLIS